MGVGAGGRRVMGWPGAAHPASVNAAMKFKETKVEISDVGMFRAEARRGCLAFSNISACLGFVYKLTTPDISGKNS